MVIRKIQRMCCNIKREISSGYIFLLCCSHALSLAVVNTCGSMEIQNFFAIAGKVYRFFDNHTKREYTLSSLCDDSSTKVKSLCKKGWLLLIDTLHVFLDLYNSIIEAPDHIVVNSSSWSHDAAMSLIKATYVYFDVIIILLNDIYLIPKI